MTAKTQKAELLNQIVSGPRGEFARQMGAEVYVNEANQLRYRDTAKGYARRISYAEFIRYLHGEDIRALRASA